jgi:hypothetical protein
MQLTLRTLLAYMDDTLEPAQARALGKRIAESEDVKQLVERIKRITRRRGLAAPETNPGDETTDPNTVAAYLDNSLDTATVKQVEETCLESDVHLAEVAACHQILTLVLTEPVRVPPRAHRRMYALVPAPASVPNRQPSKTLPISGSPPAPEHAEADDADAALLLGMGRYSSATTWAARLALFGAAAVLLVLLAGAAMMSLQPHPQQAPEVAAGHSSTAFAAPPPAARPAEKEPEPPPAPRKAPAPEAPSIPPPRPVDSKEAEPKEAKPKEAKAPGLGESVPKASNARPREIAQVKSASTFVVAQLPDNPGQWSRMRVKPDDTDGVLSNVPVMALPGYKAELIVDRKVRLRLWGNVPEQLPYRVFESKVKIHEPPEGFDADITLLAGRAYLRAERASGAKVRVRLADEVWDVALPDDRSDVLVELISWYEPGTPYAREGGSQPRREARCAVAFGSAGFAAPARARKKFEKMVAGQQVAWDSSSDTLGAPREIPPEQRGELLSAVPGDLNGRLQQNVMRLLSAMAARVTTREEVHPVVKTLVGPELPPGVEPRDHDLVTRLAIYSQAALADSTAAGADSLKPLIDVLRSKLPWLARQAAVTALVAWVARDRDNTALLFPALTGKGLEADDADWLLRLLRAFVSPTRPDPNRLDELVKPVPPRTRSFLDDPELAIREAALWNIMVAQTRSWVPPPLEVNVGASDSPEYKKFLEDMKAAVEAIKKREKK